MSPMTIGWIAFGCVFGGSVLGMLLGHVMRRQNEPVIEGSRAIVQLTMGPIAMMAALVLALLINSAKTSFDTQRNYVTELAADAVELDRILAHFGSETSDARALLRTIVVGGVGRGLWGSSEQRKVGRAEANKFAKEIRNLAPRSDFQRSLYAEAISSATQMSRTRALLFGQINGTIPMPFLVVLIFWFATLFGSFGLYARPNALVFGILIIGALSVACAIYLVLQLDRPFGGLIEISVTPLSDALEVMGK